jgi:hypothetical protein
MLKYLGGLGNGGNAPSLVGVLQHHATRLFVKIDGLANVLCVNFGRNELRMLNMPNPSIIVPDMLRRARAGLCMGGGGGSSRR